MDCRFQQFPSLRIKNLLKGLTSFGRAWPKNDMEKKTTTVNSKLGSKPSRLLS